MNCLWRFLCAMCEQRLTIEVIHLKSSHKKHQCPLRVQCNNDSCVIFKFTQHTYVKHTHIIVGPTLYCIQTIGHNLTRKI